MPDVCVKHHVLRIECITSKRDFCTLIMNKPRRAFAISKNNINNYNSKTEMPTIFHTTESNNNCGRPYRALIIIVYRVHRYDSD